MKHALVIGATGATGKDLLEFLVQDNEFHQIDIFVRRDLDLQHEKLRVHIIDFDKPEEWKHLVKGDVFFSCLGTTLKAAGSKQAQWKIDFDYQYGFAKAASENKVDTYVLVSSSNASANSMIFYTKMKGQLEVAVKALGFPKLFIFNPPLLERKHSDRKAEVIGLKVIRFFNKLGLFKSQTPLPTEVLAHAMINAAKAADNGIHAFHGKEIWACADAER